MTTAETPPEAYCWFDTEFTALDLDDARLLQVAVVVTDRDMRPLTPRTTPDVPPDTLTRLGLSAYLRAPDGWEPNEFIRTEMPTVVAACRASSYTTDDADGFLARYLDAVVGPAAESIRERPILGGNSVHTDWFLARRDLREFSARVHYRLLDVSAFKTEWLAALGGNAPRLLDKDDAAAVAAAFPDADLDGAAPHDAYYDVQASIAEMRWYRARIQLAT